MPPGRRPWSQSVVPAAGAVCGHCSRPVAGVPAVRRDGVWLCHESVGVDCYRAVVMFGHRLGCECVDRLLRHVTLRRRAPKVAHNPS